MNKNTKRVLSAITVASLSVTSFTGNIQNVVNAKEDKQEENALSTNRVNAEVLENEAGAVIRVSTSSNVQNVKTTYSVDTAGSKVVSFGDLKAGEVREIQVNFEEDSNKLKSLPKTTAVSDRVDFNKEVRGHKIKGSVSFEYDNGDNSPVVTPTVPTTPTKPGAPVVTPVEPAKPVTPGVAKPEGKKVNLMINRHGIVNGLPSVATFWIYKDVEIGTKVDFDSVKEFLKHYGFGEDYLKKFPAALDKDYIVDVYLNADGEPIADEPAKPVTPAEPTKPTEPANPVVTPTVPTTPTKPVAPVVTPVEPAKPVTPGVAKPEGKKVNLMINRHGIVNGLPSVATFWIYKDVEIGTKVDFDSVKEFLKHYGFGEDYLKKFPAALDKDYIVDVYLNADGEPIADEPAKPVTPAEPTKPAEPAKPVTPAVTPADTGLEAGMPANVRWSRAQLKEWGFTFGKITGNYKVDGDLGVFDDEDGFDKAWKSGSNSLDQKYLDGTIDDAYFKNTPHGYSWNSVTKPDGTKGYAMYLYGTDGKFNDGQKAR